MQDRFSEDAECALGKRVKFDPSIHDLPEWMSASFVVDQKGKGLVGRMVTAYGIVNDNTIGTAAPAPNVEAAFASTSGKNYHTTLDLVWGFTQLMLSK